MREYWNAHSKKKPKSDRQRKVPSVKKGTMRICARCQVEKPLDAFPKNGGYYKTSCKVCYSAYVQGKAPNPSRGSNPLPTQYPSDSAYVKPKAKRQQLLLVDRTRGQVIRCEILGEVPADVRHIDHVIAFYTAQGCRVIDSVEHEASHEHTN
jgi:hypothetical protein